ncbi:LytR/AlgR family response regulator transcription factor [Catalinimonas niigatensis]|uniref:LytR/AlgR family response regulator transcription factor n=1 Tax=Catalinimonas niigatensis TaxID=1397264 RepID=UPI0026662E30|nr:LytTR family DNA-binding domain-containing protein [Catalinimonas niigatensis]WPP49859.1 LytTR family DNA-binding domain-containing protein [Catalinimonas niigatensis]
MNTLNCIAVDDEPFALNMVCTYIEQTPFLHLAGRFSSAVDALKALHEQSVDLIFLDIQMPDLSGIELARVLDRGRSTKRPRIVFTTAYDQFAIEGYKVDALDYLLKPFNYEEFLRAVHKAQAYAEMINSKPTSPEVREAEEDYLFLKVEYQLVKVAFSDIRYIQGLKDYVKVYLLSSSKPLLSLISMKALEDKLPSRRFMRIHRSYIISLEQIKAVSRNSVEIGQESIPVSQQYKEPFSRFMERWTK